MWRNICDHQASTWLHNSFISNKTGILFQPRDLRFGVSFNLTLKRGCASLVCYHGHRRWHNSGSWDRLTRIALGSLRALVALRPWGPLISFSTLVSFGPLWSLRPGWTTLAWWTSATRPSSSSPDTFRAMHYAGQATQYNLNFFPDVATTDSFTGVWFLVFSGSQVTSVANVYFWKRHCGDVFRFSKLFQINIRRVPAYKPDKHWLTSFFFYGDSALNNLHRPASHRTMEASERFSPSQMLFTKAQFSQYLDHVDESVGSISPTNAPHYLLVILK